jgi:hypothetical protein
VKSWQSVREKIFRSPRKLREGIRKTKTLALAKGATLAFAGFALTMGTVATPAPAADFSGKRIESIIP